MYTRVKNVHRSPRTTTFHKPKPGQSIVELAIIIPLLTLMLTSLLEIGRATYATVSLSHAVRDGARIAMDSTVSNDTVKQRVVDSAAPFTVSPSDITVSNRTAGNAVTVTVSYNFHSIVPMVENLWGGGDLVLTRSCVARVED